MVERTTSAVTQPTHEVLDKTETGVVEVVKDTKIDSQIGNMVQVPSPEGIETVSHSPDGAVVGPEEQYIATRTSHELPGRGFTFFSQYYIILLTG